MSSTNLVLTPRLPDFSESLELTPQSPCFPESLDFVKQNQERILHLIGRMWEKKPAMEHITDYFQHRSFFAVTNPDRSSISLYIKGEGKSSNANAALKKFRNNTIRLFFSESTPNQLFISNVAHLTNQKEEYIDHIFQEYKTYSHLGQHDHVVQLFDGVSYQGKKKIKVAIFTQLAGITFDNYKFSDDSIQKTKDISQIFLQLFKGLSHIHSKGIIHHDLKPANIAIDERGTIRIFDFSNSGSFNETDRYGTLVYQPPETYARLGLITSNQMEVGPHIDLWSLGVILHQILFEQKVPNFSHFANQAFSFTSMLIDIIKILERSPSETETDPVFKIDDLNEILDLKLLYSEFYTHEISEINQALFRKLETLKRKFQAIHAKCLTLPRYPNPSDLDFCNKFVLIALDQIKVTLSAFLINEIDNTSNAQEPPKENKIAYLYWKLLQANYFDRLTTAEGIELLKD
jgi:serine/threonine protein kinase